jgi:hypothetical protein
VIERFDVPPGEDAAFLAAWDAEPRAATLYRALRDDVRPRYAAVPVEAGVLLIGPADEAALAHYEGRQGFIAVHRDGDLVAVHWSSPLMYARAGRSLPGAALYAPRGG